MHAEECEMNLSKEGRRYGEREREREALQSNHAICPPVLSLKNWVSRLISASARGKRETERGRERMT